MAKTKTGGFPIGFRRFGGWQQDLGVTLEWAKANDFGVIDLAGDGDTCIGDVVKAGLRLGAADLPDWKGLTQADDAARAKTLERMREYVATCCKAVGGPVNFFMVMLPADTNLSRAENSALAVRGLKELAPILEEHDARLVIEGWPGPGCVACTPEGFRVLFREVPSPAIGINYDPSHLIRQEIDHLRFAREFADRIYHVHGKDCDIEPERLYEYGIENNIVFPERRRCAGWVWRYCLPGHGQTHWTEVFTILADAGYQGAVSIELEDYRFMGTEEGEKEALLAGRVALASF